MDINTPTIFALSGAVGGFVLSWLLPHKYQNLPDWFTTAGIIFGIGCLVIAALPLLPDWVWKPRLYPAIAIVLGVLLISVGGMAISEQYSSYIGQGINTSSDLVVKPENYKNFIKFIDNAVQLSEEYPDPFDWKIKNLGKSVAYKVEFSIHIDEINVEDILNNSEAFPIVRKGFNNLIDVTTEINPDGSSKSYSHIENRTQGNFIIDSIQPNGSEAANINVPRQIKAALLVVMLDRSYKLLDKSSDPQKTLNTDWDDNIESTKYFINMHINNTIEMPNIIIKAKWVDADDAKSEQELILKSIYQPAGGSMWWPNRRDQGSHLKGGAGRLCYENLNNPDDDCYNLWEKQRSLNVQR